MTWTYRDSIFTHAPEDFLGFVYLITDPKGRKYVGQKKFWFGKSKKTRKESDWKTYFGSSRELKEEVSRGNPENFRREILYLCQNKAEMNFLELKEQMDREVLFSDDYYNGFIGSRISARGLSRIKEIL